MTVHQVVVAAVPHDAITRHALRLRDALRTLGPSDLFARYVHPALAGDVRPLDGFPAAPGRAVVFHASIGEPDVTRFLLGRPEPLAVVYHNITPAEFFEPYDPEFAARLRAGRAELAALRDRTALALGVSAYNAAELSDMGFARVGVAPLAVPARGGATTDAAGSNLAVPTFLFVGQLLPHKRPDFLVRAFHVLRTYLAPGSALVLAGADRVPRYAAAVRQFAAELALPDVRFAGEVSDGALAALYAGAAVFVTASEHEGFCAPLVEAMQAGLPVVARRFAAVPETLDGAGLLLKPEDGPAVFAEAMLAAASEGAVRDSLVDAGRRRAAALASVDPAGVFLDQLRAAVP